MINPSQTDMKWFLDARFGMFIHYGLFSLLERGEWVMNRERIATADYMKLMDRFTAEAFDADAICKIAKQSGMRYVVLTTMHHEGFALYDSDVVPFNSMKSAAKRCLVSEFVEAARKYDLKIGLYHSLNNWSCKPDGADTLENKADYDLYIQYTFDRIEELVTKFNPIDVLWYDGWWPFNADGWQAQRMNEMVRKHQPHILFNGRNGLAGDFGTPEGHMSAPSPWRPWEACITHNDSWGYSVADQNWKSPKQVIQMLATAAQGCGNLLLNIGPKPDGSIPQPSMEMLKEVGDWLTRHGDCIYQTEPFTFNLMDRTGHRGDWSYHGPFTAKGNQLHQIITRWQTEGQLTYGGIVNKIKSVTLDGMHSEVVSFTQKGDVVRVTGLPKDNPDTLYPVLTFECDGQPELNTTAGMRVPAVKHPPYDPCPSDIAH
ncbi:MAG TPA: alpha-L-fucosidase [Phycisphaerales bacterium]|nr:alpha-L-fucosidase [Phycisphaerales bacterium]HCD31821.1 alpha-L-fucosidase [Phycisphaerales bacterium]|tara:strand:- start:862 stop:2151 length:1290 start_codon:yes stop_codon:yes gene_type:complete